jgi:hypothetical protein
MSELIALSGPWAGIRQVCVYLNRNPSELVQMVQNREVLGRRFSDGNTFYPTQQFHNGQVIKGLTSVRTSLPLATQIRKPGSLGWRGAPETG